MLVYTTNKSLEVIKGEVIADGVNAIVILSLDGKIYHRSKREYFKTEAEIVEFIKTEAEIVEFIKNEKQRRTSKGNLRKNSSMIDIMDEAINERLINE